MAFCRRQRHSRRLASFTLGLPALSLCLFCLEKELREWEPGGEYVTKQLDRIWHKYTGQSGHYGLRDPKIDEKRVLFVCGIDRIATFGEP